MLELNARHLCESARPRRSVRARAGSNPGCHLRTGNGLARPALARFGRPRRSVRARALIQNPHTLHQGISLSAEPPPNLQPPRLQACRQLLGPAASRIAAMARTRDLALRGTASLASPKLRAFGTAERRSRPGRRTPSTPQRAGGPADAQTAGTGPARFGPARPTTITLCSET